MQSAERQTVYRWGFVWSGVIVAAVGFVLLGVAISRSSAWAEVASSLGLSMIGWGSLLQTLNAVTLVPALTSKGLEFDAVVVVEPAAIIEDAPAFSERLGLRLLYIALTRPTQHLSVVHALPLPDALRADETVSA